ncbi:uncharacterized protein LOC129733800 [Wyeomyia smithii]|uniref:uncharacterized protein LOC129733800 n=1 Tax=Wyeomyia smithii TaxID=174621 RepID=UPI002467BA40|nr:uncharacterized protein LOC129733800 [Wyeomyia smithii]
MASWNRTNEIPYPTVWHRFEIRNPSTGTCETYRVQDLPPDRIDDAIRHMCEYFLRDEPICASLNLAQDPIGVEEITAIWRSIAKQRCIVVCYEEGREEIVGLNMLTVVSKEDPPFDNKFESCAVKTFVGSTLYMTNEAKLFERYQHAKGFLSAWGLSVHPSYRRRGIAAQILTARVPICRAYGLPFSATVFSHPGSQIPAAKIGFRDVFTMKFADLARVGFQLAVDVEWNKLMVLEIE